MGCGENNYFNFVAVFLLFTASRLIIYSIKTHDRISVGTLPIAEFFDGLLEVLSLRTKPTVIQLLGNLSLSSMTQIVGLMDHIPYVHLLGLLAALLTWEY